MSEKYPLMEHFYTVQGEGANAGTAAYFLRLGGCDVGCVWCDVKESWDKHLHPQVSVDAMVDFVVTSGAKAVVITGGEPAMYDLTPLTSAFRNKGIQMWLETSGAYEIIGDFDWIVLSPKKFKKTAESSYLIADELKIVVYHKSDIPWAEEHAAKVRQSCKLYLQPEWSREKEMSELIVDYIKNNPRWRISLQTHKYLNIP